MQEYLNLGLFIFISVLIAAILLVLPKFFSKKINNASKLTPYECGFDPIDNDVSNFDVRFYLVAILFIIFDVEISFMIPWAISLKQISWTGFYSMMFFVFILIIGFIYEWKKEALEWE